MQAIPHPKLNIYVIGHANVLNKTFTPGRNTYFFKSELGQCAVGDATNIDVNPKHYVKDNSYINKSTSRDYIIDFVDEVQTHSLQTFGVFIYEQLPDKKNGRFFDISYNNRTDVLLSNIVTEFNTYNNGGNQYFLHICRTPVESSSSNEQEPDDFDDFADLASNVFFESPSSPSSSPRPYKKSRKSIKSGSRKQRRIRKQNKKSRRNKTKKRFINKTNH